jgi:hypothetical protein
MSNLGPQQFDIPVSDQLFQTLNPNDPIIGISVSAWVPVTIPWNLQRTELVKDKEVTFGKVRWSEAGPGPHDLYEEKLGGRREKVGTVTWSVETVSYQTVQENGPHHRWLITPCPILMRTVVRTGAGSGSVEVMKNPQPCPGKWVNTPPEVSAALAHSARLPVVAVPPGLPAESVRLTSLAAENETRPAGRRKKTGR